MLQIIDSLIVNYDLSLAQRELRGEKRKKKGEREGDLPGDVDDCVEENERDEHGDEIVARGYFFS